MSSEVPQESPPDKGRLWATKNQKSGHSTKNQSTRNQALTQMSVLPFGECHEQRRGYSCDTGIVGAVGACPDLCLGAAGHPAGQTSDPKTFFNLCSRAHR